MNEILELADDVRRERVETPLDLPETLDVSILQEAVRTIDVYLNHYKEGRDGTSFRYMPQSEIKNLDKARHDRRKIVEEAAEQLEWILSDEPADEIGITFREICDAQGTDPEMVRKLLLSSLFGEVHKNAYETLLRYLEWSENSVDIVCKCETCLL